MRISIRTSISKLVHPPNLTTAPDLSKDFLVVMTNRLQFLEKLPIT
jgi:hypothetical protein